MAEAFQVRKALRSSKAKIGLLLLLVTLLIWPLIVSVLPLNKAKLYQGMPAIYGNYRYIGEQLEKPEPIDVLLVGASGMWTGIDTQVLKQDLMSVLGREPVIVNASNNWRGEENYLAVAKAFLRARDVKLLILTETDSGHTHPHELAKYWWVEGGFGRQGLSNQERQNLQGVSMLGMGRVIWSTFFGGHNRDIAIRWRGAHERYSNLDGYSPGLRGWHSHFEPDVKDRPFVDNINWKLPTLDVDQMFYKGQEKGFFRHYRADYLPYHALIQKELSDTLQASGSKFMTVRLPTHFEKDGPDYYAYIRKMPSGFERDWPVISVPQTELFPDASFDEMKNFYGNESHFNAPGARHFTKVISPAVAKVLQE